MNMLIRFFLCWLRSKSLQHDMATTVSQSFRILPHDMSLRDHVPNFRYASFAELGRFQFWQGISADKKVGMFNAVVAAQHLVYIRPVRLFVELEMDTRVLSWDDKYFYFRHDFYVGNKLMATTLVKEALVFSGKLVKPEVFTGAAFISNSPDAPEVADVWKTLQAEVQHAPASRS